MKLRVLTFTNGIFSSVHIGCMRVSDAWLIKMSGLDTYLSQLFREFSMHMCGNRNQFNDVYGDGLFPQVLIVVAKYSTPYKNEGESTPIWLLLNRALNACLVSIIIHLCYFRFQIDVVFWSVVLSPQDLLSIRFFVKLFCLSKWISKKVQFENSYPRKIYSSRWRYKSSSSYK